MLDKAIRACGRAALAILLCAAAGCSGAGEETRLETRRFDGKTFVTLSLPDKRPLDVYTIDIMLKTEIDPSTVYEIALTTPPMPFAIGPFAAAYLNPRGYNVRINDEEGNLAIGMIVGQPERFTRLTIVGGPDGVFLYVNGGEAARSIRPARFVGVPLVGKGRRDRFWAGEIAYFDIYDVMKTLGEFDPEAGRFSEIGRIASLPAE